MKLKIGVIHKLSVLKQLLLSLRTKVASNDTFIVVVLLATTGRVLLRTGFSRL